LKIYKFYKFVIYKFKVYYRIMNLAMKKDEGKVGKLYIRYIIIKG